MDIKLYYEDNGKGIPIVMLHGNNGSSTYFNHQVEYFSKKYRVITVDTRGHGKSKRGNLPFTMDQFVLDLDNLLNELNISNFILLGFSDGANIAMKYALKYQKRIKALILCGGNIYRNGLKLTFRLPVEIGYIFTKLLSFNKKIKRKNELLYLMMYEPNIKSEKLSKIKVPTLVIAGTNDIVKESHTKEIANNIPNSKLLIIDGNHFILSNKYEILNNEIDKFLSSIKV